MWLPLIRIVVLDNQVSFAELTGMTWIGSILQEEQTPK